MAIILNIGSRQFSTTLNIGSTGDEPGPRLANGTTSGSSVVFGISNGLFVSVGTAIGSSTVSGINLVNVTTGTASGSPTVSGIGGGLANLIGTASGNSTIISLGSNVGAGYSFSNTSVVISLGSNVGNGGVTGDSYVWANNARVDGTATGIGIASASATGWYQYAPGYISCGDGYDSDGVNITIPISCLPGLDATEADAVSGNWISVLQAICYFNHYWVRAYNVEDTPETIGSFLVENLNHKSNKFQYGTGQLNTFLERFTVTYAASKLKAEN